MSTAARVTWCCDDTEEGTLHNGAGDARVEGLASQRQTDEQTAGCIASLEAAQLASLECARRAARERTRAMAAANDDGASHRASGATASASVAEPGAGAAPLADLMAPLQHFALRSPSGGAPELKLYNAMLSPDRQLIKASYFVAEGSMVIQQLLRMGSSYRLASILSTEAQLRKMLPELVEANASYAAAASAAAGVDAAADDAAADAAHGGSEAAAESAAPPPSAVAPCLVFAGSKADVSSATGFKHSALSVLAIVHRPQAQVHLPLAAWLPTLRAAPGTLRPSVLVLDGVIKPENVGALFRTALAFGVCGVVLSPGCADPLYRKSIRSSMGACFKLPYLHADAWPLELDQLRAAGYRLLALHLQGSVAHDEAIAAAAAGEGAAGAGGPAPPLAVMVGAEYEGVSDAAAARAHANVRIPMADAMEGSELDSLNVNVAAAIVLERVFAANRER